MSVSPPSAERGKPAPIIGVSEADLNRAAEVIARGGLVAIPTETVYGLAADATNDRAVARIFEAKGRPSFNPLIAHVDSVEMASQLAIVSDVARRLMDQFWPGPLTLVLPRRTDSPIGTRASASLDTIAVRHPKSPAAIGIISRIGRPLAAPSANLSEQVSPTRADHVADGLGDRIDLILDGGPCEAGVESTIVKVDETGVTLLRPGALSRQDIEEVVGPLSAPGETSEITAPGMMKRHYAPRAKLRLNATDVHPGEAFLAFGPPPEGVAATLSLSTAGDLEEAAHNLFAMMRTLDSTHAAIAVAPIPDKGLGEAINNRLTRAAARFTKNGV
ncbi:MAG: L-threonylcarbamoyladenylate synthase [Hyphomonadaceae bacterium]